MNYNLLDNFIKEICPECNHNHDCYIKLKYECSKFREYLEGQIEQLQSHIDEECTGCQYYHLQQEYEKFKQQNEQMLKAMIKSYKSECNASSCKDCLFINADCPARILSIAIESITQKKIEEVLG